MNSLYVCKPIESSLRKKVKVRSEEEEYIRYLIYTCLNKESVKKVSVLLRRFDWSKWENTILRTLFKYISKGKDLQVIIRLLNHILIAKLCMLFITNVEGFSSIY